MTETLTDRLLSFEDEFRFRPRRKGDSHFTCKQDRGIPGRDRARTVHAFNKYDIVADPNPDEHGLFGKSVSDGVNLRVFRYDWQMNDVAEAFCRRPVVCVLDPVPARSPEKSRHGSEGIIYVIEGP